MHSMYMSYDDAVKNVCPRLFAVKNEDLLHELTKSILSFRKDPNNSNRKIVENIECKLALSPQQAVDELKICLQFGEIIAMKMGWKNEYETNPELYEPLYENFTWNWSRSIDEIIRHCEAYRSSHLMQKLRDLNRDDKPLIDKYGQPADWVDLSRFGYDNEYDGNVFPDVDKSIAEDGVRELRKVIDIMTLESGRPKNEAADDGAVYRLTYKNLRLELNGILLVNPHGKSDSDKVLTKLFDNANGASYSFSLKKGSKSLRLTPSQIFSNWTRTTDREILRMFFPNMKTSMISLRNPLAITHTEQLGLTQADFDKLERFVKDKKNGLK